MTRRRWIYREGKALEVNLSHEGTPRSTTDAALWNDRLYQDDGDPRYHSRKSHRAYMERNGLSTIDDYTDTWADAKKKRESELAGIDPSRKRDLIESFQRLKEGHHNARRR
jgi:hypothetical protein